MGTVAAFENRNALLTAACSNGHEFASDAQTQLDNFAVMMSPSSCVGLAACTDLALKSSGAM
jgi:NAD-dependent dihydropyrimidine dehydrogenase PreA subunit